MTIEAEQPQPKSIVGLNNTSFPESRGGGDAATEELPTVALARLDLVTLNSISEMDAVSDRYAGRIRGALEIATEAVM